MKRSVFLVAAAIATTILLVPAGPGSGGWDGLAELGAGWALAARAGPAPGWAGWAMAPGLGARDP